MQQLPNILPLLPDELLYSWQSRLASANGYSNVDAFAQDYIYPEVKAFRSRSERHIGIDGREPFFTFALALYPKMKLPRYTSAQQYITRLPRFYLRRNNFS